MLGHMKTDGLLDRCYLKGKTGDAIHAILCGIGHNLRLLNYLREQLCPRLFLAMLRFIESAFAPASNLRLAN